MRKFFAATAAALLLATPALAADVRPMMKAPVAAPVVSNWTGFYIGAHVGYGWGEQENTIVPNDPAAAILFGPAPASPGGTPLTGSAFDTEGGFGGLQAGYNWQIAQGFVLGLEADVSGARIDGTGTVGQSLVNGLVSAIANFHEDLDWFGTVRARAGVLVTPSLLVFGTGGLAYGRLERSAIYTFTAPVGAVGFGSAGGFGFSCVIGATACYSGAGSSNEIGWTAGGGLEWAVTPNVSIKGEYLYARFEGESITIVGLPLPGFAVSSATVTFDDFELHTARVGINYKFGAAPVVARY